MKSSRAAKLVTGLILTAACLPGIVSAQYRAAEPGYRYSFPRDHFSHPEFQTEWWYYTGNVQTGDGRAFGFQLTFFRQAVQSGLSHKSQWAIQDLYLAHVALSDLAGGKFHHSERLNRAGPGIAGVSQETGRIWNGNWQVTWRDNRQEVQAITEDWSLRLALESRKVPVIHGVNGVSRKGPEPGQASHYISLTRLAVSGTIELGGDTLPVSGTAWMDHEFFTHLLAPEQVGWDWLSLQLNNQAELMLFRLRRRDGSIDPNAAATYIDPGGVARHLSAREFTLRPLEGEPRDQWTSPSSGATYPIRWRVTVPSLNLDLEITTRLSSQEVTSASRFAPTYWEGAVEASGNRGGSPINGVGYLEMTGYDRPIRLGQ
jgi:predicted secreted hydrolase